VTRLCASGLEAINQAARQIRLGEADLVLAGGVESMTRAPLAMPKAERSFPRGGPPVYDTTIGWRFVNPRMQELHGTDSMGETAENVAQRFGVSRESQDEFALESHRRALAAREAGRFDDEIVPVPVPQPKGEALTVHSDEGPRAEELERTRSYLCGLFPLSLETHDQVAEKLADLALYDLPDEEVTAFRERVRGVSAEDARDAGRRYFPLDGRVIVAVGPAKAIARPLERFGPVTVVPARKLA